MNHITNPAIKTLTISLIFLYFLPLQCQTNYQSNLRVSEKVAFFHFIDRISAWSPYCDAERVDLEYLGIPELSNEDKIILIRYASARKPLNHGAETDLFLWAEQGFPMQNKPAEYATLKAAVEYFFAKTEFREPLSRRMHALEQIAPRINDEFLLIDAKIASLHGIVNVFLANNSKKWNEIPIFLVYTLSAKHSQGGANGDGIFAEVDPSESPQKISHQCGVFLHEALHQSLHPRQAFIEFTCHGKGGRETSLCEFLKAIAPDERGDYESAMLDEILVYTISNVILEDKNPQTEFEHACRSGDKQLARLWDGVQILLPTIRQQIEKPLSKDLFLQQLIEIFVSKVHFKVWKSPCAKAAA